MVHGDNMPDTSVPDPNIKPQVTSITSVIGGVNIDAQSVTISGDLVARNKIVTNVDVALGGEAGAAAAVLTGMLMAYQANS